MPYVIFNTETREYVSRHNRSGWVSDLQDAQIYYNSKFAMNHIKSQVSVSRMQLGNSDKFPPATKANLLKIWQHRYHMFNNATVLAASLTIDSTPRK